MTTHKKYTLVALAVIALLIIVGSVWKHMDTDQSLEVVPEGDTAVDAVDMDIQHSDVETFVFKAILATNVRTITSNELYM